MKFHQFFLYQEAMMNPLYLLAIISLGLVSTPATFAEPYSPSCETAIEKLSKARKALVPFQRTMELARARERGAYGELAVCAGGGSFSAGKALRCSEWQWQAPQRTRDVIAAEDQYHQERKAFEELFEQAKLECLLEP
jgi:hypothetical protein